MFRKPRSIIFYNSFIKSIPDTVKAQIMEENRKFAVIWSIAQIFYWSFCVFMSTRQPDFRICRHIYVVALLICIITLLLAIFVVPRFPWLVQLVALAVDAAFFGAGIAIARHLSPKTIIIFASVLIVPILFISGSLPTLILLIVDIVVFAIVGRSGMEPSVYVWTLTNMIIFSSLGFLLGYYINSTRIERFIFADSMSKVAELQTRYAYYDQLTGLFNRRAYSEKTDLFAEEMPGYCCVVMADINGLKEINDKYGHEAGDELIVGSAECVRRGFKGTDTIYRIGGDEFCVIITDKDTDVSRCLKLMEEYCAGWKGKYVSGLSLSYGYADSNEFTDINSILKAADQRMFQFKRQYYLSSGRDRRR